MKLKHYNLFVNVKTEQVIVLFCKKIWIYVLTYFYKSDKIN